MIKNIRFFQGNKDIIKLLSSNPHIDINVFNYTRNDFISLSVWKNSYWNRHNICFYAEKEATRYDYSTRTSITFIAKSIYVIDKHTITHSLGETDGAMVERKLKILQISNKLD